MRAAQRALAPSQRTPVTTEQLEEAQHLRLRIQLLLAGAQSDQAETPATDSARAMPAEAELAIVDAQLNRIAHDLTKQLEETKVSQLRATLSVETAAARTEVVALLDETRVVLGYD